MKTTLKPVFLASALLAGTAVAVGVMPHAQPTKPLTPTSTQTPATSGATSTSHKPKIEVVFVLDTTSSMTGLIDAAKSNIWSIARTMASAQPAPEMNMGLVAFRDRGDAYLTKIMNLSTDLDSMYASLMDLRAEGGGDGPEDVNAALNAAINTIQWSQDASSYKVIFLVGDAPPHMDYPDETKYPELLKQAQAKGIVVNCIQAGNQADTRSTWEQIASLNQGKFLQVEQSGNAIAVTTPFDEKLAQLAKAMDETRLFYGDAEKRKSLDTKVKAAEKVHAATPAAVQAKRAEFNASAAGAANFLADSELVDAVSSGKVKLDELKKNQLPAPLQSMDLKEQAAELDRQATRRKEIKDEIAKLGAQRQDYIKSKISEEKVETSLDGKLYDAVKTQAKAKGLNYANAPSL